MDLSPKPVGKHAIDVCLKRFRAYISADDELRLAFNSVVHAYSQLATARRVRDETQALQEAASRSWQALRDGSRPIRASEGMTPEGWHRHNQEVLSLGDMCNLLESQCREHERATVWALADFRALRQSNPQVRRLWAQLVTVCGTEKDAEVRVFAVN